MKFALATGAASRARLGEYRAQQARGVRVLEDGLNPLVLDGVDLSAQDLAKTPFALIGMAPAAVRGVDPLTAAAYGAFPRTGAALPVETRTLVDEALKLTLFPFIRATEFGTVWTGKDGGAIFVLRDADEIEVKLPSAWTLRGVAGSRIRNAKAGSVYLVDSHCFG